MLPGSRFLLIAVTLATSLPAAAQTAASSTQMPRVVIPTSDRSVQPGVSRSAGRLYPWRRHITATVFWIGEEPTENNPTPNDKSSWDQNWVENFGGYDDPDPDARVANHATSDFRPKDFVPRLNPFYVALPYNDVRRYNAHKPEAPRVIPWFRRADPEPGQTTCKGRWLQIYHNGRSCYAQWEDCGPWVTDDWEYVFGEERPKNRSNQSAAIDISPAIRDYLELRSGEKCHWRFVEAAQVPYGPWKKYGPAEVSSGGAPDPEAKRRYLEYLRKLRDEQYRSGSTDTNRTR